MATKVKYGQTDDTIVSNSIFRQAIINGNCIINQAITAVNLTNGKLFGAVDMFYAKGQGTAVSAGTITQSTSANIGNSGYALLLSGVTLTGTGKVNAYTFIESLNAKLYKNKTASFSVLVYHDVGSAIDFTIKINKANSADNFSAVTNISSATAQSVANTTSTLIKFENVSLGDCSNGIEIEIEGACGAITTKNFQFTEWQFNLGSVVLPFCCGNFGEELGKCCRYYEKSYYSYTPGSSSVYGILSQAFDTQRMPGAYFTYEKLKVPTITIYSGNGTANKVSNIAGSDVGTSVATEFVSTRTFRQLTDSGYGFTAGNPYQYLFRAIARPTIA